MAKIYDSNQVEVFVAGIPINSGRADGEFLRIERDTELFVDVVGTDGEVTRSKSNDNRATATLLLMSSSLSNDALDALAEQDRRAPNGAGVGSFLVRDGSGRAIYQADACWIQNKPAASFDRMATTREWPIRIANLQETAAGNFETGI